MFSGCSLNPQYPVASKDYYNDINDYDLIRNHLPGYLIEYEKNEKLFPAQLSNTNNSTLFCRYDQRLPLGEGFQIFLTRKFSTKDDFINEKERISSIGYKCNEFFSLVSYDAYTTNMDNSTYFEYVLLDESSLEIVYVYLQTVPKNELEIDSKYLPTNYEGIDLLGFSKITE